MSSEHWFDSLARPRTRRSVLKAAVAGGIALTLPRVPGASADQGEACYKPCIEAAKARWRDADDACVHNLGGALIKTVLLAPGSGFFAAAGVGVSGLRVLGCVAQDELDYLRAAYDCTSPQCGDSRRYPGGKAGGSGSKGNCPHPAEQVACGGDCCNVTSGQQCCSCKNGTDTCCSKGKCAVCCGEDHSQ